VSEANSQKEALCFTHTAYTESSFAESNFNFSFCLGISFCAKIHFTLQIVRSQLVLMCSFLHMCWGAPSFGIFAYNLCFILTNTWRASELIKCGSSVFNKVFNKTMQKLSAELAIGDLHGTSGKGGPRRPPGSPPLISTPDYRIHTEFFKNLIGSSGFGFSLDFWSFIYSLAFGYSVLGVYSYKCGKIFLRAYLSLIVTTCSRRRSFCKLEMVECTKHKLDKTNWAVWL